MSERVTLFVPCLVDQVYPEMGIATFQLLRYLGYDVDYHAEATCCGQPAFNAGQRAEALKVARHFVDTVSASSAPLVCPSGSCAAMVKNFYPQLFVEDAFREQAQTVSGRVVELSAFLSREGQTQKLAGRFEGVVGFHNSCHAARELRIVQEPWELLKRIEGPTWVDLGEPACCGFGGLFSIKLPHVAGSMAKSRLSGFVDRGVDTLVSNDPGCIMHLRKETEALGLHMEVLHVVEFLAKSLGLPSDSLEVPSVA